MNTIFELSFNAMHTHEIERVDASIGIAWKLSKLFHSNIRCRNRSAKRYLLLDHTFEATQFTSVLYVIVDFHMKKFDLIHHKRHRYVCVSFALLLIMWAPYIDLNEKLFIAPQKLVRYGRNLSTLRFVVLFLYWKIDAKIKTNLLTGDRIQ